MRRSEQPPRKRKNTRTPAEKPKREGKTCLACNGTGIDRQRWDTWKRKNGEDSALKKMIDDPSYFSCKVCGGISNPV